MLVTFKDLKQLVATVDRNTLETTVIKHLLRITTPNIHTDILYNAESEQATDNIPADRYDFILKNVDNTCPDLYPRDSLWNQ
jgi:hypothetical protein